MGSAVLEGVSTANIKEFCFQATKRSDMNCVELQMCLFVGSQAFHFQASNLTDICSTIPQEICFAEIHE